MLKQRRQAAEAVATPLMNLETAIDNALICAGELTLAMPTARIAANLSAVVGQAAVERVSAAIGALTEARREVVEAHRELDDTRRQIGLGAVSFGLGQGKAMAPTHEVEAPPLKVVASS